MLLFIYTIVYIYIKYIFIVIQIDKHNKTEVVYTQL